MQVAFFDLICQFCISRERMNFDCRNWPVFYPYGKFHPAHVKPCCGIPLCCHLNLPQHFYTSHGSPLSKPQRPFKSFPDISTFHTPDDRTSEAYSKFRSEILSEMKSEIAENRNMRRFVGSANAEYLEKRRKNNESARRSREARKRKEDEIAIRCAFLEQENIHLRLKIEEAKKEKDMLQRLVYF
ncbi:D site-binding protein-like [Cylas formicarius]|uniref:D site-binding protein-like n=1 Tax=Cylas formicarius TaxID=197179 RepID=UPI002958C4EA|nr:D site-binding protein-like [Cylas formicarius]